jgi:exoribonuclease II
VREKPSMASPGNLVEYVHNKKLMCALILSTDRKEQVHVRTEENREDKVARSKLVFVSPESMAPDSDTSSITEWLRKASQRRDEWSRQIALEELWELTVEESKAFTLQDLASLQWSTPSNEQVSGLYRALENDKLWFTRKGQDYQPRSAEQVQETRQRLQAEQDKGRERESMLQWLKALWNDAGAAEGAGSFDKAQTRYLTWIREVALLGTEAPRFKDVQALFKELDISGKDAPFRLMVKAGVWHSDEFLSLHRLHPPIEFSPELHEQAAACARFLEEGLADPSRLDLTHLPAVTIDDEWTSEIDDALTFEELPDGYRVGIHIADASTFIVPGSGIDEEALERGTAIYLPERKIRMVPDRLGDDFCSLIAGQPRLAFSFMVEVDSDLQMRKSEMVLTRIQVSERLTYDRADELIKSGSGPLAKLFEIALAFRSGRQARGAVTLPFPRANIRVEQVAGQEPLIEIVRDASEVPGQVLVSEMMILANRLSGELFAANSIPALFRSQPEPEKPIPADVDTAPESLHKLRRLMKKGEVGLTPARHAGLGLDAYSQSTSPIRRYVDLIAQRQLKAFLAGQPLLYSQDDLSPIMMRLERTTQQAEQLERERKQFWTLRYLEQRRWAELDAVVLQNLPDKHLVQIIPILYETDCPLVPRRPLPPGSRLKVRIELAWPREGTVRVTPVLDDMDDD